MEEKKSKGYQRFKFIMAVLLIIFGMLYFAGKTGYYEKNISQNTALTKDAILAFEKDVASGKAVDIKNYINEDNKDYKNMYSKLGYNISKTIDIILNDGTSWLVNLLRSLFS